ncbi:MAG: cohesin domain-containing protein [Candidatus Bathyarchaeota archaeon]|nr:cohesin domain-containing protein [Candidatus Bathyarchaeota archaeon]
MKSKKIISIALVLLLAISIPFASINGVLAAPTGAVALGNPSGTLLPVGSTFTVSGTITGASDIWQWVFTNVNWNPAVLSLTSVSEGSFLNAGGATFYAAAPADNVHGKLPEVSSTRMSATTASGSGTLVTLTFQVIGYGSSAITVESATYSDTSANPVAIQVAGTTYTGLPPPSPYGPTAIITGVSDGAFILQGTTINVDGSSSTGGFDGSATKPVTGYSWTITNPSLSISGATGSFVATTIGDMTISLTVTATGAIPETNTKTITVHVYAPPSGAAIDVYTQKGGVGPNAPSDAFGPQQNVNITALVTYNNVPVVGKDVSFEIRDQAGELVAVRTARTDANGLATTSYRLPWPSTNPEGTFGTWSINATVDVSEVVKSDIVCFCFNYLLKTTSVATLTMTNTPATNFARDTQMQVNVTVRNIASSAYTGLICVSIFDENNVPVANAKVFVTIAGGETVSTIQTLSIPHYAFIGQAKAYVDVLTQLPSLGGVPYCPEVAQTFAITL